MHQEVCIGMLIERLIAKYEKLPTSPSALVMESPCNRTLQINKTNEDNVAK